MATPAGSPSGQIAPAGNNNSHSPRISDDGTATENMDGVARTGAANSAQTLSRFISNLARDYSEGRIGPRAAMDCVVIWVKDAKQHHVPQFLDQIIKEEQQGSARLDPTTFEQQPSSRKRRRIDDPPDNQTREPQVGEEGVGSLQCPSRPTPDTDKQRKVIEDPAARLWSERMIEDLKAQIPVADKPTMKRQENCEVAAIRFREAAIFVPAYLEKSLIKVLEDRILQATFENGDALGTSRMSLFMAAEILKLDQYHLVKLKKTDSIQPAQWTHGIDKAKSIANSGPGAKRQKLREYAACLSYLQKHTMFELWKLEPAEHRAIVEGMDDRALYRLLGLPLKDDPPRLGRAEDGGA
ncbi:hypothetical protein CONLIGDRAFT_641393 [Coniochaeta ligniaria NRRL 30616]|uniref:Uncharacterized protein n=1 Tax=Coniochaeta ligniaria NRRL 30616 TaxID=1408157 RepID=A0A1J7JNX2_9PEZI|nr:hypothetical protein CONLIGDRAFT_641393 [Coniochaeta ligniaria NRRL 30616]